MFAEDYISPEGNVISEDSWNSQKDDWLCSDTDDDYIQSLMKPCRGKGEYAGWIAAPRVGINNQTGDFEYVKIN